MKQTRLLALALLVVAALAFGVVAGCSQAGKTSDNTVTIVIKDLRFNPPKVTITEGMTVRWINEDTTAHTSTSDDYSVDATTQPEGAWTSKVLNPGDSFEHTFKKTGSYPYACQIHPYLKGTIEVKAK